MQELDSIINFLKDINKITGLKIEDNVLFENAVKIFISDRINDSKLPIKKIELKNEEDNKPTDKQIYLLKKNKISIPNTKQEATKIINTFLKKVGDY
jgi:hypothetical protein